MCAPALTLAVWAAASRNSVLSATRARERWRSDRRRKSTTSTGLAGSSMISMQPPTLEFNAFLAASTT
eukprot:5066395-Pyramimonas_sp.AAC.1